MSEKISLDSSVMIELMMYLFAGIIILRNNV